MAVASRAGRSSSQLSTGEHVVVEVPATECSDAADVLLLYRGMLVQLQRVEIYPRLRASIRLRTLREFEGAKQLLDAGLARASDSYPSADAFERSVMHLLSCLGFACSWWGPHSQSKKTEKREGRLEMPHDAPDGVAFSADNSLVLVVEATTDQPGTAKVNRLIGRARRLRDVLRADLGDNAPTVRAVLALPQPMGEIAEDVRRAAGENGVTLLTGDVAAEVVSLLDRGCSHDEVVARLPEALRGGLAGLRPVRLWGEVGG